MIDIKAWKFSFTFKQNNGSKYSRNKTKYAIKNDRY